MLIRGNDSKNWVIIFAQASKWHIRSQSCYHRFDVFRPTYLLPHIMVNMINLRLYIIYALLFTNIMWASVWMATCSLNLAKPQCNILQTQCRLCMYSMCDMKHTSGCKVLLRIAFYWRSWWWVIQTVVILFKILEKHISVCWSKESQIHCSGRAVFCCWYFFQLCISCSSVYRDSN